MPHRPDYSQWREHRVAELYATDLEFAAAAPRPDIASAIEQPGLRLAEIVHTVMNGYADRAALGQRLVDFVRDADTGRTSTQTLPRFHTITYRELWRRIGAVAAGLVGDPVRPLRPGDRVALLGFTSIEYTVIDLALISAGAVSVPLPTSTAIDDLVLIVEETEPAVLATSIEYLSDAVRLALSGAQLPRIIVFDYHHQIDDHREALDDARRRLTESSPTPVLHTFDEVAVRGADLPTPSATNDEDDPLTLLIYTSGSTGTPKGAMYTERLVSEFWLRPVSGWIGSAEPSIIVNFLPMSHVMGRQTVYGTLANGGTAYFVPDSDLSTLLDDIALVRPTELHFVPRLWDMLFEEFHRRRSRRLAQGADPAVVDDEVKTDLRDNLVGGRCLLALTGSAPISPDTRQFVESCLQLPLHEGFGSTEMGGICVDGRVQRPPVIDYRLADVPELGYTRQDKPHPRGELLVKSQTMFSGYYRRPDVTAEVFDAEGYYRTGDIVAEVATDHLIAIDRRTVVLKLSQGEFVTVSALEAVLSDSPVVHQIYLYGNSSRPYLLAVVVPTEQALADHDPASLKTVINTSLHDVAKAAGLQPYEIPRDFILETTPFTLENGLLTAMRKPARQKLKARYGQRLEELYGELADSQAGELRALASGDAQRPVLETVIHAAAAILGIAADSIEPHAHFTDLGGDSLSALTFANALRDVCSAEVPVGVIVSPATDFAALAGYIDREGQSGRDRPTFASVHGARATEVHASDLTLDEFIDTATLAQAPTLRPPTGEVRTVLLTGATGFLGRFLALEWLERLAPVGGTLICLVRAKDAAAARDRLDGVFDSGDPQLMARYRALAEDHLEVIVGDKSEPDLGLQPHTWQRLANTVDLIVDPAALVNHLLPYSELFGPNVAGTAEVIKLAITATMKPVVYASTMGVGASQLDERDQIGSAFTEDADIRAICPARRIDDSYANGYATSKWAGEVLLRRANDLCGLPVTVFRCDMILTDTKYVGQLNVPDAFTRLILSMIATGLAPLSFYELTDDGARQPSHYDALPVDFIAEAITTLGGHRNDGYQTYHVANPHDDGIGLDDYVDWLLDAGVTIRRTADYDDWFAHFCDALTALPDRQREYSLLPMVHVYEHPQVPQHGAMAPVERFRQAVREAKIGPSQDIPHISAPIITKYVTDLKALGLL